LPQLVSLLQAQTSFSCRFSQCRDSAVVLGVAAIQLGRFDPLSQGSFGQKFADRRSRIAVPAVLDLIANVLIQRGDGNEGLAGAVVDQLARKVLMTTVNMQSWMIARSACLLANAETAPFTLLADEFVLVHNKRLCFSGSGCSNAGIQVLLRA